MNPLFKNIPLWKNEEEVVDLSTRFFYLDDENNFEPNLFHHGMYQSYLGPLDYLTINYISDQGILISIKSYKSFLSLEISQYHLLIYLKKGLCSYCNSSEISRWKKLTLRAEQKNSIMVWCCSFKSQIGRKTYPIENEIC